MSMNQRYLGPYELQHRLADDPVSEVWKAFDTQQRRYVVIKLLHSNAQAPDSMPRFLSIMQQLRSLHHPNIVQVLDTQVLQGPISSTIYVVMDYVEGQTLAEHLQATSHIGQFPAAHDILRILAPLGSAIDYIHQHGIVHGAIRPNNIILDKQRLSNNPLGEPKLIGFGTNILLPPLALPLNNVYYLSPEQAQGYQENTRSDIYSLGVLLYEMCTGTQPFQGDTPTAVMMQHIHTTPTSPVLINPHLLPGLTAVIMRSLSRDQHARFPTASAMVVATARALNIHTQEIVSQSGTWMGSAINITTLSQSGLPPTAMQGPTYLSPPPQQAALPPPSIAMTPSQTPSPAIRTGSMPALPPAQAQQQWSQPMLTLTHPTSGLSAPIQAPSTPLQQTPTLFPSPTPPPSKRGRWRWLTLGIGALLVIAIISTTLGALFLYPPQNPITSTPLLGNAIFISSGQIAERSTKGIADRIQVNLQNISQPQAGKQYYFWLLGDTNGGNTDISSIRLGSSSRGGKINIFYPGDGKHSNLLLNYSRLLVTAEDADNAPTNPSLDSKDMKYFAEFSREKKGNYSLLDHMRHLLAQDPKLKEAGLAGGLDIWLFRNTLKLLEQAGSIRDAHKNGEVDFIRRQLVRMLNYLDGEQYVRTEKLPSDLPAIMIDKNIARIGLLEFDPQQNPPPYLKHIGNHLRETVSLPGVTPTQRELAITINKALNNVKVWLEAVHKIAAQLIQMSREELLADSTLPLLDDLFTQTNFAFVGQIDPNNSQIREGVVQIHYNTLRLATFEIKPYTAV